MQIIGEKINGTRKQIAEAIAKRDVDFIRNLAKRQVAGGAHWLDVNAGTTLADEPADLVWLVRTVQEVADVALSLDSTNPLALEAALAEVKQRPMINSISGEQSRITRILPLVAKHSCPVIALALDDAAIPTSVEQRMDVIRRLFDRTRDAGVADDQVYVDPVVLAVATDTGSVLVSLETMRQVRTEFPTAHLCCGLSNVSFGLPERSLVNRTFLTLALEAGLDTAIADPTDRELIREMWAAELVLGRDPFCRGYTRAYRSGRLASAV